MSGIKPLPVTLFYRRLHQRGETTSSLAAKIGSSRAHVVQVVNHSRARHLPASRLRKFLKCPKPTGTWKRLKQILTAEELALLDQVPRGAKFHGSEGDVCP